MAELSLDYEYFGVLNVLSGSVKSPTVSALQQDAAFEISPNWVQKRVGQLRDYDLISVDQLNTTALVQLLLMRKLVRGGYVGNRKVTVDTVKGWVALALAGDV